jgi:hypothetical protein
VVSHNLRLLRAQGARHQRPQAKAACYISYYPHWQHPETPEAMQVYQYAPEVDELRVPVLVFVGEHEQYQRVRPILAGIASLKAKKREARVIVYPGVARLRLPAAGSTHPGRRPRGAGLARAGGALDRGSNQAINTIDSRAPCPD